MNMLKLTRLGLFLLISLSFVAHSTENRIEAKGKVFYKLPSEEIVKRDVSLLVPSRGQGQITLKGKNSEVSTDHFFTRKRNSRSVFYVLFKNPPHAPPHTQMLLRGTYTRGSNMAVYYGDIFSKKVEAEDSIWSDIEYLKTIEDSEFNELTKNWTFKGGFFFKAMVDQ